MNSIFHAGIALDHPTLGRALGLIGLACALAGLYELWNSTRGK